LEPARLAVVSDGSVLIGDGPRDGGFGGLVGGVARSPPGFGRGIWRFKDGVLSQVAGFDLGETTVYFQDGQGGQVTFGSLDRICRGPGDTFYVLDNQFQFRKVFLDGTVETMDKPPESEGFVQSFLICATNQRAFVGRMPNSKWVFGDLGSGQTFSTFSIAPWFLGEFFYGLGDGLAVTGHDGVSAWDVTIVVADTRTGVVAPWIKLITSDSHQLDSPPYALPFSPQIVIDDDNMAYIYTGYALLRYKLPDRLQ
jgi:hypothetical protein